MYRVLDGVDVAALCARLPSQLRQEMQRVDAGVMQHLEDAQRVNAVVLRALSNIVSASSWTQTVKGIASTGLVNSVWYALRKLNKYLMSVSNS